MDAESAGGGGNSPQAEKMIDSLGLAMNIKVKKV